MDKMCSRCGALKPRDAFYRNKGWRDGLHPYCKSCLRAYQSERRFARLDAVDPTRQQWTRRHVVHDYFNVIDRPIKAYLLGLIAADGNVLGTTPRLTLELAIKDIELVELFRAEIAPGVPIRKREPRPGHFGGPQVSVAVTSAVLVEGLARWGIVPRKTFNYRWPSALPDMMKRPYLLGHFDGDGFTTVSRSSSTYRYGRWGILGTRPFVEHVRDFLASELKILRRAVHDRDGVWSYYVTGRDAEAIDVWLHRDFDFGLARKSLSLNAPAV